MSGLAWPARRVLGVDPGPDPGFFLLGVEGGRVVLAERRVGAGVDVLVPGDVLAVEAFVMSRATARAGSVQSSHQTVAQVLKLHDLALERGLRWESLPAGVVKPWATDCRLDEYGLLELTVGHRHTRDAARMALYVARRLGLVSAFPQ